MRKILFQLLSIALLLPLLTACNNDDDPGLTEQERLIIGATWELEGIYTTSGGTEARSNPPTTLRLNFLQTGFVTINGIPGSTWRIEGNNITFTYLTGLNFGTSSSTFEIKRLTAGNLDLGTSANASFGIISINAEQQLRFLPQQ